LFLQIPNGQCYAVAKFPEFNYKNAIHKQNFRMNSENFATSKHYPYQTHGEKSS
jgi:hypothetical protein